MNLPLDIAPAPTELEHQGELDAALAAAAECGQRNDWGAARRCIQSASKLAPGNAEVKAMLGQLDFQLEDYTAAKTHLSAAAKMGAHEVAVFINLAIAHLKLGETPGAEATLSVAVLLWPEDPRILAGLGELRQAAGNHEEALTAYIRLITVAPTVPEHHMAAARCLRELGRWSEAAKYLERARDLAPASREVEREQQMLEEARRQLVNVLLEGKRKTISVLSGARYATCAIPLDYPPSRALQPRWGGSRPPHAGLLALFARRNDQYRATIARIRELEPSFRQINCTFASEAAPEPGWIGSAMNALDLAVLYHFVHHYRPATYLEIGSGASTCFARRAVTDHALRTRIVSIDPEPRAAIDRICDEVIRSGLETLPDLQIFADLQPGDIVFMDGSHRSFMNSDVTVFMLDILPLLKPGVIVHIHDIALPYDYADMFRDWYWNEQYLVATYLLAAADRIEVLMPVNHVATDSTVRDCLEPAIMPGVGAPGYWKSGGSLWFTHRGA